MAATARDQGAAVAQGRTSVSLCSTCAPSGGRSSAAELTTRKLIGKPEQKPGSECGRSSVGAGEPMPIPDLRSRVDFGWILSILPGGSSGTRIWRSNCQALGVEGRCSDETHSSLASTVVCAC